VLVKQVKQIFKILNGLHRFYEAFLAAFFFDERPS
jgi:hypothetical protein